jgi:hypothetical protein
LETREANQRNFDDYVTKLKEWSKSDKPSRYPSPFCLRGLTRLVVVVWEAAAEAEAKRKSELEAKLREQRRQQTLEASEIQKRKEEIRRHSTSPG